METNTTVDVTIGNPRSSTGETWVEVRITDGPSGMVLAEFRMDPGDWYGLLHGGVRQDVPAFVTTKVERIGKQYDSVTKSSPAELRWDRDASPEDLIAATELPDGWDGFDHARLNRTNAGSTVTFMRWLDAPVSSGAES